MDNRSIRAAPLNGIGMSRIKQVIELGVTMTIRRAIEEDAEAVLSLTKRLFSELDHQLPMGDEESLSYCKRVLRGHEYIVFISDGPDREANGVLTMSESLSIYAGGKFGIIEEFYVVPKMRSGGVGKELLKRAKAFGKDNGWKRIEVTLPDKATWPRTHNFYTRELFKEIGPRLKFEYPDEKLS